MHKTTKRIIASVLLFSHTLMSCNNLILPDKKVLNTVEPEVRKQHPEIDKATFLPSTFILTTKQGQNISFQEKYGSWQAELVQEGTTNKILPIVFAPGYALSDVYSTSLQEQQQLVHLVASEEDVNQPSYLYIGNTSTTLQPIDNQLTTQEVSKTPYSIQTPEAAGYTTASKSVLSWPSNTPLSEHQDLASKQLALVKGNIATQSILANEEPYITQKALARPHGGHPTSPITLTPKKRTSYQPNNQAQHLTSSVPSATLSERNAFQPPKRETLTNQHHGISSSRAKRSLSANKSTELTKQPTIENITINQNESILATNTPLVFQTKGGYQVHFEHPDDKWATVKESIPPFSRTLHLPLLYKAPHIDLATLSKQSIIHQQYHMHVCLPERASNKQGYVYIGSMGLMGGGKVCKDCKIDKANVGGECGRCLQCCKHVGGHGHAQNKTSQPTRSSYNIPNNNPHRNTIPINQQRRDFARRMLAKSKKYNEQFKVLKDQLMIGVFLDKLKENGIDLQKTIPDVWRLQQEIGTFIANMEIQIGFFISAFEQEYDNFKELGIESMHKESIQKANMLKLSCSPHKPTLHLNVVQILMKRYLEIGRNILQGSDSYIRETIEHLENLFALIDQYTIPDINAWIRDIRLSRDEKLESIYGIDVATKEKLLEESNSFMEKAWNLRDRQVKPLLAIMRNMKIAHENKQEEQKRRQLEEYRLNKSILAIEKEIKDREQTRYRERAKVETFIKQLIAERPALVNNPDRGTVIKQLAKEAEELESIHASLLANWQQGLEEVKKKRIAHSSLMERFMKGDTPRDSLTVDELIQVRFLIEEDKYMEQYQQECLKEDNRLAKLIYATKGIQIVIKKLQAAEDLIAVVKHEQAVSKDGLDSLRVSMLAAGRDLIYAGTELVVRLQQNFGDGDIDSFNQILLDKQGAFNKATQILFAAQGQPEVSITRSHQEEIKKQPEESNMNQVEEQFRQTKLNNEAPQNMEEFINVSFFEFEKQESEGCEQEDKEREEQERECREDRMRIIAKVSEEVASIEATFLSTKQQLNQLQAWNSVVATFSEEIKKCLHILKLQHEVLMRNLSILDNVPGSDEEVRSQRKSLVNKTLALLDETDNLLKKTRQEQEKHEREPKEQENKEKEQRGQHMKTVYQASEEVESIASNFIKIKRQLQESNPAKSTFIEEIKKAVGEIKYPAASSGVFSK